EGRALLANRMRFGAEGTERTTRVCSCPEQSSGEGVIRLGNLEHRLDHAKEPGLEVTLTLEDGLTGDEMLIVNALIERLDEVILRAEVVIGIAERNAGALGNGPHRRLIIAALAEEIERSLEDARPRLRTLRRPANWMLEDHWAAPSSFL